MLDVIEDGLAVVFHAGKVISSNSLLDDFGEEGFGLVKPAAVSRNEIQMPVVWRATP
jgi:hypothetical protein